jgi:hypothetical protein
MNFTEKIFPSVAVRISAAFTALIFTLYPFHSGGSLDRLWQ